MSPSTASEEGTRGPHRGGGRTWARQRHQALLAEYLAIDGDRLSAVQAACRLGVSVRHAIRIRVKLRTDREAFLDALTELIFDGIDA